MKFARVTSAIKTRVDWQNPTRRAFIKRTAAAGVASGVALFGYGAAIRNRVTLSHVDVAITNLPAEFDGFTIGQLSDLHHGIYTDADAIRHCVELLNAQKPDVVALTGDYTFASRSYIEPCADILSELKPKVGTYAVLGNHDYYQGAGHVVRAMRRVNINMLVDQRERLLLRGAALSLFGVDDLYYGQTSVPRLLRDVPVAETKVVLAHNPDFIEEFAVKDAHIDLMLSGHTHGGQIRFPILGAPHIDSDYGQRYAMGLNRCQQMQVYTTRGVGSILLPVRLDCPPEVVLFRLRQA